MTVAESNGGSCPQRGREITQRCERECIPNANCQGEWTGWGSCSKGCEGGTQDRTWRVTTVATGTGTCNPPSPQSRACNTHVCPPTPQNCRGYWQGEAEGQDNWSIHPCSEGCYTGSGQKPLRSRQWNQIEAQVGSGLPCTDSDGSVLRDGTVKTQECNVDNICINDVDCVGRWVQSALCSAKSCGTGTREEKFEISVPKEGGGEICESVADARRHFACDHPSGPCPPSTANWKDVSLTWWDQNNWSDFFDGNPEWWRTGEQTKEACKEGCEANNNGNTGAGNPDKFRYCIAYLWKPTAEKKCLFSNNLPAASIAKAANENTNTESDERTMDPTYSITVNLTPDNQLGYSAWA